MQMYIRADQIQRSVATTCFVAVELLLLVSVYDGFRRPVTFHDLLIFARGSVIEVRVMASHRNGKGLVKVDHTQLGATANLKASSSFKSKTSNIRHASSDANSDDPVSGRVRVAVRLRPQNAKEMALIR
ncbi:hypothetical protein L6452_05761 [Arctium lappa]|uniref:Uncharacterized protein n=1 Tax=Arctium lappa TaxID=4217 RepID=A0ACB9EHZ7_ARCLA|nr:hypothetical protein L6452_05761 [Arctium lappa]